MKTRKIRSKEVVSRQRKEFRGGSVSSNFAKPSAPMEFRSTWHFDLFVLFEEWPALPLLRSFKNCKSQTFMFPLDMNSLAILSYKCNSLKLKPSQNFLDYCVKHNYLLALDEMQKITIIAKMADLCDDRLFNGP